MIYTRRDVGKIALAGLPAAKLMGAAKPNSNFGGVQIGTITYSFRSLPSSAEQVLGYCVECGISAIELMSNVAESYAGISQGGRGGAPGGAPGGQPGAGGPARGRGEATPEQQAAQRAGQEETRKRRLSVSMDTYKKFRQMYNDAGVSIYAFKLPPTMSMTDDEYDYIWNVAETLGANHITMELPTDDALLQRVAEYAAKRRLYISFHTHGQGGASGFDKVLAASPYTSLNFDVGHFFGVNGISPVPLVEKYHARITSLHLKDRAAPPPADAQGAGGRGGGANMVWGQGGTPLREVLQSMRRNKYTFPASIEYEYNTPEGSDVLAEMRKCVEFCRKALA